MLMAFMRWFGAPEDVIVVVDANDDDDANIVNAGAPDALEQASINERGWQHSMVNVTTTTTTTTRKKYLEAIDDDFDDKMSEQESM